MSNIKGIFVLDAVKAESMIINFEREGWRIFRLPEGISTKNEFFDAIRRTLPLDPPLHSNRSWDALADSVWSGLDSLEDERIVIVWPDTKSMEAKAPEDFTIASSVLNGLPDSLADKKITGGIIKNVVVISTIIPDELG